MRYIDIFVRHLDISILVFFFCILQYDPICVSAFKYCALVVKEGGMEKLLTLIADSRPYERIKELANSVIENCCQYESHSDDVNVSHSSLDAEYSLDG